MRAADRKGAGHAGQTCSSQNQLILLSARSRHHHFDTLDACDQSRHRVHQNGTRIGRQTARDIQTDRVDRRDTLPQLVAVFVANREALFEFVFVEHADAASRFFQSRTLIFRQRFERLTHLFSRDHQIGKLFCGQSVKARRVFEHGRIAALTHIINNRFGPTRDLRINTRVNGHQFTEFLLEVCLGRRQTTNLHYFLPTNLAFLFLSTALFGNRAHGVHDRHQLFTLELHGCLIDDEAR